MTFLRNTRTIEVSSNTTLPLVQNTDFRVLVSNGASLTMPSHVGNNSAYTLVNTGTSTIQVFSADGNELVFVPNGTSMTILATGGGWVIESSSGGSFGFREVPQSGWSYINKGTAVFGRTANSRFMTVVGGGGNNNRIEFRPLPRSSNYTVTATITNLLFNPGYGLWESWALYLTDGTKFTNIGYGQDNVGSARYLFAGRWWNSTSHAGNLYAAAADYRESLTARIRDNGTSRFYEVLSLDGVTWVTLGTEAVTDFMVPTHVGWGINNTYPANEANRTGGRLSQFTFMLS